MALETKSIFRSNLGTSAVVPDIPPRTSIIPSPFPGERQQYFRELMTCKPGDTANSELRHEFIGSNKNILNLE